MFFRPTGQIIGAGFALIALVAFGGCDKLKRKSPAGTKAETKRQQAACASPVAYDRLKNSIFDEAIAKRPVGRPNLDTLADYSVVRMENPVVKGWDPALDITQCKGRFILEVPPGAERGLGGARQLQAEIEYTAQASADGVGWVYQQRGADAIIGKLAAFNLGALAFRPPPAIDPDRPESSASEQASVREAQTLKPLPSTDEKLPAGNVAEQTAQGQAPTGALRGRVAERVPSASTPRPGAPGRASGGEGAVRAFYAALSAGNGAAAASQVIPEKRSSGPLSARAISRFYGHLPEPLRLTSVSPTSGAYRVMYRYSAGRSHCNGVALVRVADRRGRELISSIRSLSGC